MIHNDEFEIASAKVMNDINKLIEDKLENHYGFWLFEHEFKVKSIQLDWDFFKIGNKIGCSIIKSPFYKRTTLDAFLTDFVGSDYSKNYTKEDWNRHYRIENLGMKLNNY